MKGKWLFHRYLVLPQPDIRLERVLQSMQDKWCFKNDTLTD